MLSTSVQYLGGAVEVTVDYHGYIASEALSAEGEQYVHEVLACISRAKDFAAAGLLDTYNQNWRRAEDSELTGAEFCEALQLSGLQILDEPGTACAIFADGDMFGGHSVIVDFAGSEPSYVTLFG
jgi:hypothetical protein